MAGEKIVVVEDERVVARDIEKRLVKLGYAVPAIAASAEEALQKVADHHPDLVLMDIQLQGETDGIEAAEAIRVNFGIPVIYLTAFADETTLQRAKATEPFGYRIKPFDERELHVAIEVALRRRLAEAAIRVALEKEQELRELKSRFWTMFAHEFRTPMTSILSCAQVMEQYGNTMPESRRREYLYLIQNSIRSMDNLLNDVLTVARAEGGSLEFSPTVVNLEQFCRELVEETQFISDSTHSISVTSQGNCTTTYLDKKLLWHILSNLLSNAIKYSPSGSQIRLDLCCPEGDVVLTVQDMGIGIPLEDQPYLFEPFHRASNVGTVPGTGLGLTLVKKCLDLHGGQIQVNSTPGEGTTVTLRLHSSPSCAIAEQLPNR
jgi:signal transduction histidine kinase